MTGPYHFQVMKLPSGGYKVFVWGHESGHLMDWAGCNYQITPVTGQPRRGYKDPEQAYLLLEELEEDERGDKKRTKEEWYRANDVNGTFFGDNSPYEMCESLSVWREKHPKELCGLVHCYGAAGTGKVEKFCIKEKGHSGVCSTKRPGSHG